MNITMIRFVMKYCTRPMLHMLDEIVSSPDQRRIVKRPADEVTMNALYDRGLVNIELIAERTYEVRLHDSIHMELTVLRQMAVERKHEEMAKECAR